MILCIYITHTTLSFFGGYIKSPLYQICHDRKSWSGARAGHRNIRDGPYHACTCHAGKTHGNEVASGGVGLYAKLDSFLIGGDVFCLHKGWVDMFQFLMSWCCLGFKFANKLWKCWTCWTWVQPWSLKDVGLCISWAFTVCIIRWNATPPTDSKFNRKWRSVKGFLPKKAIVKVQTVAGRGYLLLIVEIWWSLKISKLPHDLMGQPPLTC